MSAVRDIYNKLTLATQSAARSPVCAAFVIISIALVFSGHQEVLAKDAPYDEYYFLLRSDSFNLMGSRLAPIKEYLYSLFIHVSRIYGLSLRNFEVICYGIALAWLWLQVRRLTSRTFMAWFAVLPLAVFTYQSPVFNLTTYDALQLILTPLSIGSAIWIFRTRAELGALIIAGVIAGLQVLTRPEGVLFLAPPLVSVIFVIFLLAAQKNWRFRLMLFAKSAFVVCIIPIVFQQAMSAVNEVYFGFWAPTIMKSEDFTGALSALMSIKPKNGDGGRYAPVPISALEQAYWVSPAFREAKGYFSPNLGGSGWSAWAPKGYETRDGSIDGGHFQWALLEASAYVAGPSAKRMLAYLRTVSEQLDAGFDSGLLEKRTVISPAVGPNFSLFDRHYWQSVKRIARIMINFGNPLLPQVGYASTNPEIEHNFDLLALRRTALVQSGERQIVGWMVDPAKGIPSSISLNQTAFASGVALKLIDRPDVAGIILGLGEAQAAHPMVGFQLVVPGTPKGNEGSVVVAYDGAVTDIPISKLMATAQGTGISIHGVRIQVDQVVKSPDLSQSSEFSRAWWTSLGSYYGMRVLFIVTAIFLVGAALAALLGVYATIMVELSLIVTICFSVVLPRLALLSAIDAFMYPGIQPRYLAVAELSLWFLVTFVISCSISHIFTLMRSHANERYNEARRVEG